VADLNLLDLLSADHQNLLEAAPAIEVLEVSQHLSVERDLLFPLISDRLSNGNDIVEDLRQAERELEERLRDFERDATEEHEGRLKETIEEHVTEQEQLFARLRELLPESDLLKPVETVALTLEERLLTPIRTWLRAGRSVSSSRTSPALPTTRSIGCTTGRALGVADRGPR
jgi:hypothetical protein